MKAELCCAFLLLLAIADVQGHRDLKQSSIAIASSTGGVATSYATSSDGGNAMSVAKSKKGSNAKAKSSARGRGAEATTVAEAEDGADVEAETNVKSKKGAKVKAATVAKGKGPKKTKVKQSLTSSKDIAVGLYIKRVSDGEDIDIVAKELVVVFGEHPQAHLRDAFVTGLSGDEKSVALFHKAIELFFAGKDCGAVIKPIFKGHEGDYILYHLPSIVAKCIYVPCSGLESAKYCCGEAQLKNPHCSCADGKCLWAKPAHQNPYVPYWDCQDCVDGIDYCTCH